MRALHVAVTCLSLLAVSCTPGERAPEASHPSAVPPGARPSRFEGLVIVVVVDQLPSRVFRRYLEHLPDDGAIRPAARAGALFEQAVYSYAATFTAPGHASIYTGAAPAESGVVTNEMYDRVRKAALPVTEDARHAVFGRPSVFAGPSVLRTQTVGDRLFDETEGRGRTVSVSLKDRSAVLSGGKKATLAVWYEKDPGIFTTSSYYAKDVPPWLTEINARLSAPAWLARWEVSDANELASLLGPDDGPGEGDFLGLGTMFPHDPGSSQSPLSAVRLMPQAVDVTFDIAERAVAELRLGQGQGPDLLAVSVSSTDYVGHTFGPDSWEYLEMLRHVDRRLSRFLRVVGEDRPLRVLLTSDHGAAPTPERASAEGHGGGRLYADEIVDHVEKTLTARFGSSRYVAAFSEPFLYLSEEARASGERDAIVAAAVQAVAALPGVHAAYDTRAARALRGSGDPLERAVGASITDDSPADVYLVQKPWVVFDENMPRGRGTSHGSPWAYDRAVPVLVWGDGVPHVEEAGPVAQARVAPTIAALLGVAAPAQAKEPPLVVVTAPAAR